MKLSVIYPVHNQFELATAAIDVAISNLSGENDVEFVVLDNGSTEPFLYYPGLHEHLRHVLSSCKVVRSEKNIGVYPTFWWALRESSGDVLAFFHSDLMVSEKGWDTRLINVFEQNALLGLVGFIGSDEIDSSGGRGRGTISNFQGGHYEHSDGLGVRREWLGSPAQAHGMTSSELTPASVVDGCAMVFSRPVLEQISQREDFPPHHFYDRLLSCEVREKGYEVAVLGIGCDHISGQTVNKEKGYDDMAREWAESHGLTMEGVHNWDSVIYREAERQWLKEYRDEKCLVPCRVILPIK